MVIATRLSKAFLSTNKQGDRANKLLDKVAMHESEQLADLHLISLQKTIVMIATAARNDDQYRQLKTQIVAV